MNNNEYVFSELIWILTHGMQVENQRHAVTRGLSEEFEKGRIFDEIYKQCIEETMVTISGKATDDYSIKLDTVIVGRSTFSTQLLFRVLEDITGQTLLLKDGTRLRKNRCDEKFYLAVKYADEPLSPILVLSLGLVYLVAPLAD